MKIVPWSLTHVLLPTLHCHMYLSSIKQLSHLCSQWVCLLLHLLHAVLSFRAANGGAVGVLGSGVTLTNLTSNIFEANTADNTLSSATNDGDGGM